MLFNRPDVLACELSNVMNLETKAIFIACSPYYKFYRFAS